MLNLTDNIPQKQINGELFVKLINEHDEVIYEGNQKNLVVNNGFLILAGLVASDFNYQISQFAFGDGTTTPLSSDEDMQGSNKRKLPINTSRTTIFGANTARVYWEIVFNDDIAGQDMGATNPWNATVSFTVKEFGLFSQNDTLFNRIVWSGPDLELSKGIKLEGYFAITFEDI